MTEDNVTVLRFPFNGGLDERTTPEWLAPGNNQAQVLNGVFNKNGSIDKRYGAACLSHTVQAGGPSFAFTSPQRVVGTRKSGLLALTKMAAFNRSTDAATLAPIGAIPNVRATRNPLPGDSSNQGLDYVLCDFSGSLRMALFIGKGGLTAQVFNRDNGSFYQEAKVIAASATAVFQAFLYNNGATVLIIYSTATNYFALEYNVGLGTYGAGSSIDVTGGNAFADACQFIGDPSLGAIVAYTTSSWTGISLRYIKPGLIIGGAVVVVAPSVNLTSFPSVAGTWGEAVNVTWCQFLAGPTSNVWVQPYSADALFTPAAAFSLAGIANTNIVNCHMGAVSRLTATASCVPVVLFTSTFGPFGAYYVFNNNGTGIVANVWPYGYTPTSKPVLDSDGSVLIMCSLACNGMSTTGATTAGTQALLRFGLGSANYTVSGLPVATVAPRQLISSIASSWGNQYLSCGPLAAGVVPTRFAYPGMLQGDDVGGSGNTTYWFQSDFYLDQSLLFRADELGDGVHFASGCPFTFDGVQVFEDGFYYYPTQTALSGGSAGAGSYLYAVVYRRMDTAGNILRSSPAFFTSANFNVTLTIPRYSVPWSANAPLSVINVYADIYRCSAAGGTTLFLIGSVACSPATTPALLAANNTVTFTDTTSASFSGGNSILYTTGGVLDCINPPSSWMQVAHKNRIWRVDETRKRVWFTQVVTQGETAGWNESLSFDCSEGGDITALASLDDKLILFKADSIWVVYGGEGPAATGQGSDITTPQKIAGDIGAIDWRSVVLTPDGVMFQGTSGIHLLDRGMTVSYIGKNVEDTVSAQPIITGSCLVPNQQHVRFSCTDFNGNSTIVVYDYLQKAWSTAQYPNATGGIASCANIPGFQPLTGYSFSQFAFVSGDGNLWMEHLPTDAHPYLDDNTAFAGTFVTTTIKTPWIRLQGIQGYQRARRFLLYGNNFSSVGVAMSAAVNYSAVQSQYETWAPGTLTGGGQVSAHIGASLNKQESIQFTLNDIPGAVLGTGRGMRWVDYEVELQQIGLRYRKIPAYATLALTSISPATGPTGGGTAVTILGAGFTGVDTVTGVKFNGTNATSIVVVNDYTITCVTPAGAVGTQPFTVTTPKGTVTGSFTYANLAPTIASISPSIGFYDGGDAVTITGTNFTGATGATIGGVACTSVVVVNPTTVTAVTGAKARSTGNAVAVTTPGGTGSGSAFEYFDPTSLPGGGTAVTYYTARHCTNSGNGTPVTAVPDSKSTNTGVVGGSPTFTAANASYNNYPTMTFSGASTFLTTTNAGGITTGARTVCYVGHGSNTPNDAFWVSDSQTRDELHFVDATPGIETTSDAGGTNLVGRTRTGASITVCVWTGTASAKLFDTEQTPSTGSAGAIPDLTGSTFRFGNHGIGPVSNTSQTGPMAEALIYASALSTSDAQYLEVGYGKIYNITIAP